MTQIELETLRLVQTASRKYINSKPDWAQLRAATAATILTALVSKPNAYQHTKSALCKQATEYADILIKTLQQTEQ